MGKIKILAFTFMILMNLLFFGYSQTLAELKDEEHMLLKERRVLKKVFYFIIPT